MQTRFVRNDRTALGSREYRGSALAEGRHVGSIEFTYGQWRILNAGPGVAFDAARRYMRAHDAIEAIVAAQEVHDDDTVDGLTKAERTILDVEEQFAFSPGRISAARLQLLPGFTETRWLQLLNALLDRPEAAQYKPATVQRLRERRDRHRRSTHSGDRMVTGTTAPCPLCGAGIGHDACATNGRVRVGADFADAS